jgi:predicted DNA-binding protein (MmcQ/YjbR family)
MTAALEARLRAVALSLPEAWEDFPWGERVVKVGKKIFLFLWVNEAELGVTVKLPASREFALMLPGCAPMGYGLGRSGWVTAHVREPPAIDPALLEDWVLESYRAIAPKRLVARLPLPAPPA